MKIAFDSWVFARRFANHGTQVYARNLLAQFQKMALNGEGFEVFSFAHPDERDLESFPKPGDGLQMVRTRSAGLDRWWRIGAGSMAAAKAGADVMFCPTSLTLAVSRVPAVVTIHDVTPMLTPSHTARVTFMLRTLVRTSAKLAKSIITVSEWSKKDLVETCGIPPEKITVVYNGYDRDVFNDAPVDPRTLSAVKQKFELLRPYVFHHSVIQPRKNLVRLIEAHRRLLEKQPSQELDLVLAGPLGWKYEEVVEAARNNRTARGRTLLLGAVTDADLATLIKGASLVVIPSLYEGFCLPMVEAMACGAPVIASTTSCLPEISGGALWYFDPTSPDEMAEKMLAVLQNEEIQGRLGRAGIERARLFSWETCARATMDVIRSVGEQRRQPRG